MGHFLHSRIICIFCLIFLLISMGSIIFLSYYQHQSNKAPPADKVFDTTRYPAVRQEIGGFFLSRFSGNRRIITIKADNFLVEKKKLGFLRFGLMNEARLDNAVLAIYADKIQNGGVDKKHRKITSQRLTYKDLFSGETLSPISSKRIYSVTMTPVRIELHGDRTTVTTISADSGKIRPTKRDILFMGNVRLVSGDKVLLTDQARLIPEKGEIGCDHPFTLSISGQKRTGNHLLTDVFLNPLKKPPRRQECKVKRKEDTFKNIS